MTERYYVVSESELERLTRAAVVEALVDSLRWGKEDQELYDAEAACRARPVPEWATHFVDANNYVGLFIGKNEELKR